MESNILIENVYYTGASIGGSFVGLEIISSGVNLVLNGTNLIDMSWSLSKVQLKEKAFNKKH